MSQPETPELAPQGGDDSAFNALLNRPAPKPEGDEAPEDDEPQDDADAQDDPGGGEEPPADDDPEVEWEAGGKAFKVKSSELRAGYMKDADYRQKTAEVAEQRRHAEALASQIAQERQQAASQLDVFIASLQKELLGSQPDPTLIDVDPQEFLRQQAGYQQRANQFQAALQHRQAVQGRIDAETSRQQEEYVKEQTAALMDKLPAWRDEATRGKESAEIAEYLREIGYSNDELQMLSDHRALLIARDAAKFRTLQAAKSKQAPPAIGKTVKPGASRPDSSSSARYDAAIAKARKTGDPDDIMRAIALKGAQQ